MSMTGAGLSAARKSAVEAVTPVQSSDPAAVSAYNDAIRLADSNAIVTYIQNNAKATGIDTGANSGSSHNLSIT